MYHHIYYTISYVGLPSHACFHGVRLHKVNAADHSEARPWTVHEDIQMASNSDIMIITGIKMEYLSLKENEYGSNHFFNVLDITPLQDLTELRKSLKMLIWDYNVNFYLSMM